MEIIESFREFQNVENLVTLLQTSERERTFEHDSSGPFESPVLPSVPGILSSEKQLNVKVGLTRIQRTWSVAPEYLHILAASDYE